MSSTEPKWTFAQKFHVDFNVAASELASRLDALNSGLGAPPDVLHAVASDLSLLTKNLSDATGSLPSYDQRRCELQLKALEKRIEELRGASASAHKFSFKRRVAKQKPSTEHASLVGSSSAEPQLALVEPAKTLTALSHRYLTILDVSSHGSSEEVSISDLNGCIVNLLPSGEDHTRITALHVQRVTGSVVLLPRIAGSIILHDVLKCVIVVGCHQFRMHNSATVDVYIESVSDPIIEHCSDILFASYPNDLVRNGSVQDSKCISVKDFSHILSTSSPNWCSLPGEGCEKSWPVFPLSDRELREELERMFSGRLQPKSENGL